MKPFLRLLLESLGIIQGTHEALLHEMRQLRQAYEERNPIPPTPEKPDASPPNT